MLPSLLFTLLDSFILLNLIRSLKKCWIPTSPSQYQYHVRQDRLRNRRRCPPSAPSDWESRVFHFHGFEQLPSKKQEYTVTPTFYFGGVEWYLKLYPGGQKTSQDGFIGLFLHRQARGGTIRIQWKIRIYYSDGAVVKPVMYENESEFPAKGFRYGTDNFIKRSDIISSSKPILRDGTLSICLWMRPTLGMPTTFIPPYNLANFMTPLFNSPKHADIMFVVQSAHTEEAGDEDAGTTREDEGSKEAADSFEVVQFKSANNPTKDDEGGQENQIYVHRLILQSCAPGLAMLCEPYANMTPVPIKGVNLAAFKLALKYVCGVQLQYSDWRNHSKELMDAADRFGLTHLKVEAEAWFVLSTTITSKNALELLQYADAKTFPSLKEAVMKYLLKNKIEAQKIILSSDDFPSSKTLLLDLFGAMVHDGSTYAPGPGDADFKYRAMDVDSLRRESYVNGLDCDGQREYLISNLAKVARRDMQS